MNPAPLAAWTETRHLPVIGLVAAAIVVVGVLWFVLRDRGAPAPDADSDREQQARTQARRAALGGIASATIFVLLFWQGPWWFDGLHIRKTDLEPADGVVITGFRTGLVALAAGLIAGVGLYYTHKKHQLEQQQFQHAQEQFAESQTQFETTILEAQKRDSRQAELTREGQVTGRYIEAIKLLASKQQHEVLGGIYSLERIMKDSTRDRDNIVEVLAAYARTRLNGKPAEIQKFDEEATQESKVIPLSEDIRAALNVLGRNWTEDGRGPDLRNIDLASWDASEINLTGARLNHTDLAGAWLDRAKLRHSNLQSAFLNGSHLRELSANHADLSGAQASQATFTRARLNHAILVGADLRKAQLDGAKLINADLGHADLEKANLAGANATKANLQYTDLKGTSLDGADLLGADLTHAQNLQPKQLCAALIYRSTRIPKNLRQSPLVQARIEQCEEALMAGTDPSPWDPTAHWTE